ncbi:MAG: acyltransferase family protein, partial [Burkholderiaceae bacterium]
LALAYVYTCATWLGCFALTGLFMRYLGRRNSVLRYLAESSYWVYLLHLPVVIAIGALLFPLDWGVAAKLAVNTALTTLAGLLSYQLLVRHTPVGWLLNGRKKHDPGVL